jgi:hypothetical protein
MLARVTHRVGEYALKHYTGIDKHGSARLSQHCRLKEDKLSSQFIRLLWTAHSYSLPFESVTHYIIPYLFHEKEDYHDIIGMCGECIGPS